MTTETKIVLPETNAGANDVRGSELRTIEGLAVRWQTGTPDVRERGRETFWCATRGCNGKIFHRTLDYLNGHVMPLSDSCHDEPTGAVPVGDDGDYAWTGWHEESCEQCDTQWACSCEVVAWMRLPHFSANAASETRRTGLPPSP